MSGTAPPPDQKVYLVRRFGGVDMPNIPALMAWLNKQGAVGWQLVAVDQGVGYLMAPAGTQPQGEVEE